MRVIYVVRIISSFVLLVNDIPHSTICLSIHLLMDTGVVCSVGLSQVKLLWTFLYQSLYGCIFSFLLGMGHMVVVGLINYHTVFGRVIPFYVTTKMRVPFLVWILVPLNPCQHLVTCKPFYFFGGFNISWVMMLSILFVLFTTCISSLMCPFIKWGCFLIIHLSILI